MKIYKLRKSTLGDQFSIIHERIKAHDAQLMLKDMMVHMFDNISKGGFKIN